MSKIYVIIMCEYKREEFSVKNDCNWISSRIF